MPVSPAPAEVDTSLHGRSAATAIRSSSTTAAPPAGPRFRRGLRDNHVHPGTAIP